MDTYNRTKTAGWGRFRSSITTQVTVPEYPVNGFQFSIASSMNLTKKSSKRIKKKIIEPENIIGYFSITGILHIKPLVQENAGCLSHCNHQYDLHKLHISIHFQIIFFNNTVTYRIRKLYI